MKRRVCLAAALLLPAAFAAVPRRALLDPKDPASGWAAAPSEGVALKLSSDAGARVPALRFDFDFQGHAGWAAARKDFPARLPDNWALEIRLRGEAPPETLEVKMIDPGGQNVWWSVRRDFTFPRDGKTLRLRKRQFSFAWGPAGGGEIREAGAIEITITAGSGGKGTVWLEELAFEELPPEPAVPRPPSSRASSSAPESGPELAVDGDPATAWKSDPAAGEPQELRLDLQGRRELGGLALDWDAADFPRRYAVELSEDGTTWTLARNVSASRGGRTWIYLPDSESAFVRLRLERSARGRGYALREAAIEPPSFSETPTAFLQAVARDAPPGQWPRSLCGEQLYWALVGVDGGREKGLLSEDGALETGRGAFSLEPFLRVGGKLLGWADAQSEQTLSDGDLPIPSVLRRHGNGLSLEITALADGPPAGSTLYARYRVTNGGPTAVRTTLSLALRPLQVNPPWQFLNAPGGFAPIHRVAWDGAAAEVDGSRRVVPLSAPTSFGATAFDEGEIASWLARGELPAAASASDPDGFASAALTWDLEIPPGGFRQAVVAVPLSGAAAPIRPAGPEGAVRDFEARLASARRSWREKLDRVSLDLPPEASGLARAMRANLAWILVNRDGPGIQPGSRSYARSWIRDGALTGAALLRLGHAEEVREFLLWFAPFQFASGAVPCCVDRRGADPVPENDSHGELLYLAGEYLRFTADLATIQQIWPHLARAAAYLDTLRDKRRTEEYRSGEKLLFFGLLPESISHEGYSDHPVHSYWDDFWGVRGLSDAAELARALGKTEDAERIGASRDQIRDDLQASIRRVIAARGIDYIPGSADLADLDPTSTTIALEPGAEASRLPRRELERTFERYWESFVERRESNDPKSLYTPYEWRVAGSLVRLGQRDRAQALFAYFLADRRPAAWNQWGEVVFRDVRAPRFIGDMPHGWVGSDFIRSLLDAVAWEREEDGALVLAAGIPADWTRSPEGFSIRNLRTRRGPLDLSAREQGGRLRIRIGGRLAAPPGGFVVRAPLPGPASHATVNGRDTRISGDGEILVAEVPADVVIWK